MDEPQYVQIWKMLDGLHLERNGNTGLRTQDAATIVGFAEKVQTEISEFVKEVIARVKAKDDKALQKAQFDKSFHREKLGRLRYDTAVANPDAKLYVDA
jgi:hypothetical protein